jgi:hypothetical protein
MPIPYLHHELFELNDGLLTKKYEIEGVGPIVVIDQTYKYPSDIALMLDQAWVPSFHYGTDSANYKDYFDCRHNIQVTKTDHPKENEIQMLIRDMAKNYLGYDCIDEEHDYQFNCFSWINPPESNDIQMMPHRDSTTSLFIASVTYLNDNENHGTAFYKSYDKTIDEALDVRANIAEDAELAEVIAGKKNRTIIYPSWYIHGAYMEDHSEWTENNWRYSQVYFNRVKPDIKL